MLQLKFRTIENKYELISTLIILYYDKKKLKYSRQFQIDTI